MNRTRFYRFLLTLCVCFSFSFAQANEKNQGETKVVVSADMPGEETITTVEITDEDIEKRNADTLDKALELLPGVDVRKGGAGIPRVNIRGAFGGIRGGIRDVHL